MTRPLLLKIEALTIAAVLLVFSLGASVTWVMHHSEVDPVSDTQKIARSLEIIRTSTPANHKILKVLFYGQSITRSGWDEAVIEHWHQRYPNTVFVVQNRALGGFASPALLRTTEQDIAAFYPDLIIFHVYGDHRAYEKIIRLFRSRTAADVIVQTDHGEQLPDAPCPEGLRLTLHRPPGCRGLLWLRQRNWYDEMSYHIIPRLAKRYGLAVEPQRLWWSDYLLQTHVHPEALLADDIHPNEKGNELIAAFLDRYFDNLVDTWNGQQEHSVVSIPVRSLEDTDGHGTFSFEGSRVELIATRRVAVWPTITVDGHDPKDMDGCYLATRASSIGTVPDWPAVRRIFLTHDHVAQDWTATMTQISPDQKSFAFTVEASKTGNEGSGNSSHDFVSRSGILGIEKQDWMLARAYDLKHIPLRTPFHVYWSVVNICDGVPEEVDRGDGTKQYRYVLAAGLANERHSLNITSDADNLGVVSEFRAYRPPCMIDSTWCRSLPIASAGFLGRAAKLASVW
jgi:hypothetical protein